MEEQVAIALWQIPAADAAREQNIAADQQIIFSRKKAEASRTMPGHFEHLHFEAEKIAGRRRFDQEIRLDRFDFQFEAKPAKEIAIRNHRRGFGMTADLAIEPPLDLRHI